MGTTHSPSSFTTSPLSSPLLLSSLLQLVEPEHHPTYEHCRRPENIQKNRYANITACKSSHRMLCCHGDWRFILRFKVIIISHA